MSALSRRRFLTIASSAAIAGKAGGARAAPLFQWRGVAMGTGATITLAHPDAEQITQRAVAEIDRLEDIFSLYRPGSAISTLNRLGSLDEPPFELLECLSLCDAVHNASGGLFDPTVQPLWRLYADSHGHPQEKALAELRGRVGWAGLSFGPSRVEFARLGMALTLNGVAQGYIADRVARLLRAEGLSDILVETGEFHALGREPGGADWPLRLKAGDEMLPFVVPLRDRALASSAPQGTIFDDGGKAGHILNPLTLRPSTALWRLVSVTADSAAVADALSTTFCLMDRGAIEKTLVMFPGAEIAWIG